MTCPTCNQPFDTAECPICAPLARIVAASRQNRRNYAQRKESERTAAAKQVRPPSIGSGGSMAEVNGETWMPYKD